MTDVLRASSDAAARERLRLEAVTGRSLVGGLLGTLALKLRHLGSDDAARSGLRYQPVAWTAIAVTAVSFYFPGRPEPVADTTPLAAPRAAVADVTPAAPAAPTAPTPPRPVVSSPAFTPTAPVFTPPPPSSTFTTAPSGSGASSAPLAVRGSGWASSLSGTGISSAEVPEGSIPVGARLGQVDKASFVRLAGGGTTLTLVEDEAGAREALGAGLVAVCRITDPGWAEEPDQSMDDAPAWDETTCVAGVEVEGTWTFDLSTLGKPDAETGFALVPDAAAPPDFQVTFRVASP